MTMYAYVKKLLNIERLSREDEETLRQNVARFAGSDELFPSRILKHLAKPGLVIDERDRAAISSTLLAMQAAKGRNPHRSCHAPSAKSIPSKLRELVLKQLQCLADQKIAVPARKNDSLLESYNPPVFTYSALESGDVRALRIPDQLTERNYIDFFRALIWLEEAYNGVDLRRYDMSDARLTWLEGGDCFSIEVPGLAQSRLSLTSGSRLLLTGEKLSRPYEGYILRVDRDDILVKFHKEFPASSACGLGFQVRFLTSRISFVRCHEGIVRVAKRPDLLFPNPKDASKMLPALIEVTGFFNERLNIHQQKAVVNTLRNVARPAPYILFGPPGTGKTVTLVEIILQVYANRSGARILICANSNDCIDLITERLLNCPLMNRNHLVRISATHRMMDRIPPKLELVTKLISEITIEDLKNVRIFTTTCVQAATLNKFNLKFDYVFVDEAGQASEPESSIALSLLEPHGCCVLAGDHKQLGPVIKSDHAEKCGLGKSFLERLALRPVYQRREGRKRDAYDTRYITKLLVSYRSDSRVLAVSNRFFYDDELKFHTTTPSRWMKLFKVETPIMFDPVKGRTQREDRSLSNPNEAIRCLEYVKRLYGAGLKPSQLGIICPYRRQVEIFKLLLPSFCLHPCKVATVEKFQGDEREVIIISTVRSSLGKSKRLESLEFLFNPRRFNVAVSRAKWLVIAVGDPDILQQDIHWSEYLKVAQRIKN